MNSETDYWCISGWNWFSNGSLIILVKRFLYLIKTRNSPVFLSSYLLSILVVIFYNFNIESLHTFPSRFSSFFFQTLRLFKRVRKINFMKGNLISPLCDRHVLLAEKHEIQISNFNIKKVFCVVCVHTHTFPCFHKRRTTRNLHEREEYWCFIVLTKLKNTLF